MKNVSDNLLFSASDLSNHLACAHATSLDFEVASGHRESPKWQSPDLWILQERGRLHEEAYIKHLRDQGLSVEDLRVTAADQMAAEATRISMKTGVDVIMQATFATGRWYGRADVLRRCHAALKSRNMFCKGVLRHSNPGTSRDVCTQIPDRNRCTQEG
jgi:uncharacterized protein